MSRVIREFHTIVELLARGRFREKLDGQLVDLLEALEASADETAKGALQVTLSFQRIGDKIDIKGALKLTPPPDKPFPATTLFVAEGGLSLEHPSQTDIFAGPREAPRKSS